MHRWATIRHTCIQYTTTQHRVENHPPTAPHKDRYSSSTSLPYREQGTHTWTMWSHTYILYGTGVWMWAHACAFASHMRDEVWMEIYRRVCARQTGRKTKSPATRGRDVLRERLACRVRVRFVRLCASVWTDAGCSLRCSISVAVCCGEKGSGGLAHACPPLGLRPIYHQMHNADKSHLFEAAHGTLHTLTRPDRRMEYVYTFSENDPDR